MLVENKVLNFNNLVDKFFFGGEIYVRLCVIKIIIKGFLEWKEKVNRLCDVIFYEELVGYFNDVNDFKVFFVIEFFGIKEYLNLKVIIRRNYNFEL